MPRITNDPVTLPHGRPAFAAGGPADLYSQQYPDPAEDTTGTAVPLISDNDEDA